MHGLIRIFTGCTGHFVGFVVVRLRSDILDMLADLSLAGRTEHFVTFFLAGMLNRNEPRHDKTNKVTVRPAKTQISLDIHPV